VEAATGRVTLRELTQTSGLGRTRDEHELTVAFDSVGYRHLTAAALTNGLLTLDSPGS
jgi:hypothetical protein